VQYAAGKTPRREAQQPNNQHSGDYLQGDFGAVNQILNRTAMLAKTEHSTTFL